MDSQVATQGLAHGSRGDELAGMAAAAQRAATRAVQPEQAAAWRRLAARALTLEAEAREKVAA